MPDRSSKKRNEEEDPNVIAFQNIQDAVNEDTEDEEPESDEEDKPEPYLRPRENGKNPAAVALGRLGGLKGGRARAKKLSPERRSEIAQEAARARWAKDREGEDA